MKKALFTLVCVLLITSCNNNENKDFQPTQIDFIEVGIGELSGNGAENISQSNQIITNQVEWESLMNQMDSVNDVSNSFSEIDIDFENYRIIAIFLEVKPNGWKIEINEVIENENSINISKQETEYLTLAITQPYHIIKIPIFEKTIIFDW